MSASRLLDLIAERKLVSEKSLQKLRDQVASAGEDVPAEKITKLLVKKEKITARQAKQLLEEVAAAEAEANAASLSGSSSSIGLQPLDSSSSLALIEPADEGDEELEELESLEELEPVQAASDESLRVVDSGELEPLEPIDESFDSLQPLDAMEPADSATPVLDSGELSEVQPMSDSIGAPIDFSDEAPVGGSQARKKKGILAQLLPGRRGPVKRANRWDSPLLLIGGGALVLLLFGGTLLWFLMTRGSGDEVFQLAEEDYKSQSYSQALGKFEQFLERYPKHPKVSLAKCRVSLSKMRQSVENQKDWDRAYDLAKSELGSMNREDAFEEVKDELSGILPEIYQGFVTRASDLEAADQKQTELDKANLALELITNPEYCPTSVRQPMQNRLDKTKQQVELIERDIARAGELKSTIEKIAAAASAGDTGGAYDARKALLSRYPGLSNNPELSESVRKITSAEVARVQVIEASLKSSGTDRQRTALRKIMLADRVSDKPAALADIVVPVLARGGLYGLDADTGEPLWQRWMGFRTRTSPWLVDDRPGADILAMDEQNHEILRLAAKDGKLVWRLAMDEPIVAMNLVDGRLLVATASGKLMVVNPEDGNVILAAQVPQSLVGAPALDAQAGVLYQPGEHSSLFVFDAESLECKDVYYLGHKPGTIELPPLINSGFVFVVENAGQQALLHVLRPAEEGSSLLPAIDAVRLDGTVSQPLLSDRRRVVVATDLGAVRVFEVDPAQAEAPVRTIAEELNTRQESLRQYLAVKGAEIYSAADSLVRYELQASRGELVSKWVNKSDDEYVGPLQLFGNVLIHQRRKYGSLATSVSAIRMPSGNSRAAPQPLWSVDLAVPPSGEALINKGLAVPSSNGGLWQIGRDAMSSGKLTEASRGAASGLRPPFASAKLIDKGVIVLGSAEGKPSALLLDPASRRPVLQVSFDIPNKQLAVPPIPQSRGGFVVCTADGPVYLLDSSGKKQMDPFQPEIEPGKNVEWLLPAESNGNVFVAEKRGLVYRLGQKQKPKSHLSMLGQQKLEQTLKGQLTLLGSTLFAVAGDDTASPDQLLVLPASTLKPSAALELGAKVVWGPQRVNVGRPALIVTTDDHRLHFVSADGKLAWQTQLPSGLAGRPAVSKGNLLCACSDGQLLRVGIDSGEVTPWGSDRPFLDVGRPLGAGPVVSGNRVVLLGDDSTVLFAELPR